MGGVGDRAGLHGTVRRRGGLDGPVALLLRLRGDLRRDQHPHRRRRHPGVRTAGGAGLVDHAEPGQGGDRPEPTVRAGALRGRGRRDHRGGTPAGAEGDDRPRPGFSRQRTEHGHRHGADPGRRRPERHGRHPVVSQRPVRHAAGRHAERFRADRRSRPRVLHPSQQRGDEAAHPVAEGVRGQRHPLHTVPLPGSAGSLRHLCLPAEVPLRAHRRDDTATRRPVGPRRGRGQVPDRAGRRPGSRHADGHLHLRRRHGPGVDAYLLRPADGVHRWYDHVPGRRRSGRQPGYAGAGLAVQRRVEPAVEGERERHDHRGAVRAVPGRDRRVHRERSPGRTVDLQRRVQPAMGSAVATT
ncbi:hypothetical protein SBRY_40145 [Actinacidiphila bryophytorum]|uniref:Uncharacterized protein n=1 Tax=Actinacidiphila bryophytorum TaxID=1436133 RepID=A0A9W4MHU9_9ACTN|nr:hypothetical protein SBRY_40145 [Actinacidiphila bryophytorum]